MPYRLSYRIAKILIRNTGMPALYRIFNNTDRNHISVEWLFIYQWNGYWLENLIPYTVKKILQVTLII
jgi:hypothetical protein